MRKSKKFKIEGIKKQYEVKELRIKEILDFLQGTVFAEDTGLDEFQKQFQDTLLPLCSNLEYEELLDMAPSEVKVIWDEFREVNAAFFEIAREAGLTEFLNNLKGAIIGDFGRLLAGSSKPDTSK